MAASTDKSVCVHVHALSLTLYTLLLKVWPTDHQHQHSPDILKEWWGHRLSCPTLVLVSQNLHFNKVPDG